MSIVRPLSQDHRTKVTDFIIKPSPYRPEINPEPYTELMQIYSEGNNACEARRWLWELSEDGYTRQGPLPEPDGYITDVWEW